MFRLIKATVFACIAMAAGSLSLAVSADQPLDTEYAELQPLATHSMLLDITRIGDALVAVGERGHVLLSDDGHTWRQAEHVPTRSTLTTVFGYGDRLWAGGHDAVILTSGDGGQTWTQLFFDPERQQAVMDILFTDEEHGIAIGSYGLYLTTEDGGHTWHEDTVDPDIDYHLNSLVRSGGGRWLIAGEAGYSYRSLDDGASWEGLDLPYLGSMWGALETADGCVLMYGLRGHVLRSCDFGDTWIELDSDSESSISGAAEYDGSVLMAANSGTLLLLDDEGRISTYHHSSGVDFSAVISLGNGQFLLAGEDGIHRYPEDSHEQ